MPKGIEKLREYLTKEGKSQAAAGRAVERSEAWISRLLSGEIPEERVTVAEARAWELWSGGAVPVDAWAKEDDDARRD